MRRLKTSGWTRFLALCLAVISLSMLVSGGLGIRAANRERLKDESELQDIRSRIDEYREISAALMDRASYEQLNQTLDKKQKQYNIDTAKHRADLSTYTATNSGLEMGTAALNQAENALEAGKTQYEMGRKALRASLNAFAQIDSVIGPIQTQSETIRDILYLAERMLRGEEADAGDPHDGSVLKLQQAVRKLTALIENELPEPLPTETPPTETPPTETPPTETPPTETPPTETPPTETPPTETPPTETPLTETPLPEDPPPEAPQPEPSDDPPPDTENTEPPHSPNTGEETDLSGRLNEAIRDVADAAAVVEEDATEIAKLAKSINLPPEILQTVLNGAGVSNEDELRKSIITAIRESGIVINEEQGNALGRMLENLSAADELMRTVTEQIQQFTKAAETVEGEADAMTEYLLAGLRNAGNGSGNYPFTENEMIAIRTMYLSNKDVIEETLDTAEGNRQQAYGTVLHAETSFERIFTLVGQLAGAKATLDETWAAMKEMGEQIEEGEAALAEGRAKLDAAKDVQKKKAEELDKRKRELDEQEKALKQSGELVEEQKKLEDREKTLRAALLSREEIRRRSRYGEELLSASERWVTELTEQSAQRYRDRFDASILMIVCAILALAGAFTSFGDKRSRVLTLILTMLYLAFSLSAAFLLYRMGRGISWSAVVTALIAAAELLLLIPSFTPAAQVAGPAGQGNVQRRKTGTK